MEDGGFVAWGSSSHANVFPLLTLSIVHDVKDQVRHRICVSSHFVKLECIVIGS
jgi:hypothetical protein